ncbi:MAG: protein kinase domain-containing protein [Chloroflexota bacterium]
MAFNTGENVGAYRIVEQLGQGGMATVYKAYHASLDRYVALKVLHPAFNEDKSFELRFQREARVVAKLEHPHIVPIYDYAEHEHRPYLVMKFIPGETLKARLQRGPLSSGEIQQVVDSVGSALAYAHSQGILHRDVKPSNVLISTEGVMYLADFGLARIAQAGESTLSSDSIMGTPQYISPEQAMGKKELDEGTDIYSFAVMLYEMVVGQVPFNADTPFSIIHDHIYTPLPMPRKVNPRVPEVVERVLLKALSKERADRFASVDEMIRAFKSAWVDAGVPMRGTTITLPHGMSPVGPTVPPSPGPAQAIQLKPRKRFPWALAAGTIALALCLLAGAFALRGGLFFKKQAGASPTPIPTTAVDPGPGGFDLPRITMLDDFEGMTLPGSLGWQGYTDDVAPGRAICEISSEVAYGGAHALRFEFKIPPDGWATCGLYFDSPQDWRAGTGISFQLRSEQAGIPYRVDFFTGEPGALESYTFMGVTPEESVNGWALIQVRWDMAPGVEWESHAGQPFDPSQAAGFAIGYSAADNGPTSGILWLDDFALFGQPQTPISEDAVERVRIAVADATNRPEDPHAHMTLALAYWEAGQRRQALESLKNAADLAPADREFLQNSAQEFATREAWGPASSLYIRLMHTYPPDEPVPEEVLNGMHEAVYKSVGEMDLLNLLQFEMVENIDPAMGLVMRGRAALLSGKAEDARSYVEKARSVKPDFREAALLEAEILVRENRTDEARAALSSISATPGLPEWIRIMVESLMKNLP